MGVTLQPSGVAVEPTHLALVNRLHVVADQPAVTTDTPESVLERLAFKVF